MRSERSAADGGVLVVLPGRRGRSATVDARSIAAAGLARAVGGRLGGADVLTSDGLVALEDLEAGSVRANSSPSAGRAVARRVPRSLRPLVGDIRNWRHDRVFRSVAAQIAGRRYQVVLQFHRRFQTVGRQIASRSGAPLVLRVEALEVREEAAWGVRRPAYGRLVERLGEWPVIGDADLIVSVSDVLDAQLRAAGIPADRRLVLPNGVDVDKFRPGHYDAHLRRANGLDGRFVVGWVGGFRPFHGLEVVPDLARRLKDRCPSAVICLVGTGPLRERLIEETRDLEGVRIAAPVPHDQVPGWLRSFDACLLLGDGEAFHYSPMKLYEYLACGKPVIASRVGQVAQVFPTGHDEMLVAPGDVDAVVDRIERLVALPGLRASLGAEGRSFAVREASWEARADTLVTALADKGLVSSSWRAAS